MIVAERRCGHPDCTVCPIAHVEIEIPAPEDMAPTSEYWAALCPECSIVWPIGAVSKRFFEHGKVWRLANGTLHGLTPLAERIIWYAAYKIAADLALECLGGVRPLSEFELYYRAMRAGLTAGRAYHIPCPGEGRIASYPMRENSLELPRTRGTDA